MAKNSEYFRKFPTIEYDGTLAKNLLRRVDIRTDVRSLLSEFYAYTMTDGEKIEHIAHDYYDDIDMDWLIYLTNDVIDPYYDIILKEELFEDFIVKKYQSRRRALRKTKSYVNNYASDVSSLSTSAYEALPGDRKKYWEPMYGINNRIISYERSKEDFTASTNMIVNLDFTTESTGTFQVGEVISLSSNTNATAEVTWANTTSITIQHVSGAFEANTNYNIIGDESAATATVNYDSYNRITDVIPSSEQVYFERLSFYDYENELNESKRSIYLMSSAYKRMLSKRLDELMNKG